MSFIRSTLVGAVLATGLTAVLSTSAAAETFLKMDAFPPAGSIGQFHVAFATVVQKHTDIKIQMSVGKVGTKAMIDVSKKRVDLSVTSPVVIHFMKKRLAMFKKVEGAEKMPDNIRGLVGHGSGPYHIVVYEDSGIKSLHELKGKKVFLGPPASLAYRQTSAIVAAATGLKPGVDYEAVKFDWQTASTAFVDRQMDVMFQPTTIPSPMIRQFSLVSKIRFLTIPKDPKNPVAMAKVFKFPGRVKMQIPAGIYENQVNEGPVDAISGWVSLSTHKWLPDEIAYTMVKAFWENIGEVHATAKWMEGINRDTAFSDMTLKLHPGAYKYYKEQGFKVPARVIPDEAK